MPYCNPCDRYFATENGYRNHVANSSAHNYHEYDCEDCGRSFTSEYALHQHCSDSEDHPYCISCKRMFRNFNNLNQHLRSRVHVGNSIQCPWCKINFTTASGVTIHIESGTCTKSGLDRGKLNDIVQRMDRKNIITKPLLTMPGWDRTELVATELAWNGRAYQCYLCSGQYASLRALDQHINSGTHEQNIYHCPKRSCGREYKSLSGLIQHMESESCGVMRFEQIQKGARSGIGNMVGRMLKG